MAEVKTSRVRWSSYYRLISSRYPPVDVFEDIADPEDWWTLGIAEGRTNPRLEETFGNLDLVPRDRLVGGPGASWALAPFVHVSADNKGRFHDGTFGAFYAARAFETALFETIYHRERFYRATNEDPGWISQLRELVGSIDARLHDLRKGKHPDLLDPDDYAASQAFARKVRSEGSNGVAYPSVRHAGGDCFAAFYPDVMGPPKQGRHVAYHWDGERVDLVRFETGKREVFRVVSGDEAG